MNCIATNVECENAIIKKDSIGRQKTYCGITNKMITSKSSCPKQLGGKEKPMAKGFIKNAFYKDPTGKRFMFVRCVEMMAKSGQEMVSNIGIYESEKDVPRVLEIPYDVLQCVEVKGDGFEFVGCQSTVNSYDKEIFDELERVKNEYEKLYQLWADDVVKKKNVEKKLETAEKRANEYEEKCAKYSVTFEEMNNTINGLQSDIEQADNKVVELSNKLEGKNESINRHEFRNKALLSLIPYELQSEARKLLGSIMLKHDLGDHDFCEEQSAFYKLIEQLVGIIEEEECDLKEYAEIAAKKVILQAIKDLAKLTND